MQIQLPPGGYLFGAAFIVCVVLTLVGLRSLGAHPGRSLTCSAVILILSFLTSLAAPALWLQVAQLMEWAPEMGFHTADIIYILDRARWFNFVVGALSFLCFLLGITLGALTFRRLQRELSHLRPPS